MLLYFNLFVSSTWFRLGFLPFFGFVFRTQVFCVYVSVNLLIWHFKVVVLSILALSWDSSRILMFLIEGRGTISYHNCLFNHTEVKNHNSSALFSTSLDCSQMWQIYFFLLSGILHKPPISKKNWSFLISRIFLMIRIRYTNEMHDICIKKPFRSTILQMQFNSKQLLKPPPLQINLPGGSHAELLIVSRIQADCQWCLPVNS